MVHIDEVQGDLGELAIAICDRHFGVGGDGLLAMKQLEKNRLLLRMFNPDGTEDFCGNGLRCAAVHAKKMGWADDEFVLVHLEHEVGVKLEGDRVKTTIGTATYDPKVVPTTTHELFRSNIELGGEPFVASSLTTGSTHTIIPVQTLPEDPWFSKISHKIEHDPIFPDRTSIIWTQVVKPNHLKVRIWERGVGETLGCGTGSSAAAADYLRATEGLGTVQVDNPGGTVFVSMNGWNQPITIEGSAECVYSGEFKWHDSHHG